MCPNWLARLHAVKSHEFTFAALLLCHCIVASDRESRPASPNFAPPQFFWRVRLPIRLQFDTLYFSPIAVAQESRIVARRRVPIRSFTFGSQGVERFIGATREAQ